MQESPGREADASALEDRSDFAAKPRVAGPKTGLGEPKGKMRAAQEPAFSSATN